MLKSIFTGSFAIGMVVAGYFLFGFLAPDPSDPHSAESAALPVEQVETELTGVPMLVEGRVQGYLLMKLKVSLDRNKMQHSELDVKPYLSDAAFRATFDFAGTGVKRIRSRDVSDLADSIKLLAEASLGEGSILAINLEQFNLIRAEEVRDRLFNVH
jgi:hypothetical protein